MSESFADLFEQSLASKTIRTGELVKGIVIDVTSDHVTVSAGLKSECPIPAEQFANEDGVVEAKPGDEVDVCIEAVDFFGEGTILSRQRAKLAAAWEALAKNFEANETINGTITGKVKGGFTVEVQGIRAFLPGSLVDMRPVRDTTYLEGKDLEFRVIKLDRKRNNVVVSRRSVVEAESSAEREELLANLQEGQEVKGIVKNLTDYGAFIDLGGIDGLLHITDMSWKRVKHPSEVVQVSDEINVKILKFDRERNRVSLGMKQLGEDPWADIQRRYPEGTRMFGRVSNITDYGCFVEIEMGVEGLVHVSEMDWTNKNVNPNKVVTLGDEIEVMVLDIDEERRRISLGVKQCQANPWQEFADKHNKDERVTGKIKSITDFGIFIGLDGNIDGLVHLSDISWDLTGEEAVRNYKKGQDIETVILAIDPERERISLGVKQLDSDPFAAFLEKHPKGTIVSGKIIEVDAKGAKVQLSEEMEGYIRVSEISKDKVDDARNVLKEGEEVEARILNTDKKNRLVNLSIKAKDAKEEADAIKEYSRSTEKESSGATLGDLFKDKMGGGDKAEE